MDQDRPPGVSRQFTARLERVRHGLARLDEQVAVMRERAAADPGVSEEELAEFARSAEAPDDLAAVQRHVDRGDFTWSQVLAGSADDDSARRLHAQARSALADAAELFQIADEIMRAQGLSADEATTLAAEELERKRGTSGG